MATSLAEVEVPSAKWIWFVPFGATGITMSRSMSEKSDEGALVTSIPPCKKRSYTNESLASISLS